MLAQKAPSSKFNSQFCQEGKQKQKQKVCAPGHAEVLGAVELL
jgi:hypothetical protein